MRIEEMRLDGNAAGGVLLQIFAHDMTAAMVTCAGCGSAAPMAALLDYGGPMGVILRCPVCDTALLRVACTPGWVRMDTSGVAMWAMPE